MIEKDKILVVKSSNEVIISYMGKRLIVSDNEFIKKNIEEIKVWYINRIK
jgi:hypothetical protein